MWAIDAAFVKATTDILATDGWSGVLVHWPLYAVVASGVVGTFLLEAAFAAGPLAASQSALLIVDPLASIAMGLQLFGEQLSHSPQAIAGQVVCLLVMFLGVVLLSVWAPPTVEGHTADAAPTARARCRTLRARPVVSRSQRPRRSIRREGPVDRARPRAADMARRPP